MNWEDAQTLTGHVNNAVWVNQDYFFVIKFNRPVADSLYLPMGETEKGKRIVATFDIQPGDELMMKVAPFHYERSRSQEELGSGNSCLGL